MVCKRYITIETPARRSGMRTLPLKSIMSGCQNRLTILLICLPVLPTMTVPLRTLNAPPSSGTAAAQTLPTCQCATRHLSSSFQALIKLKIDRVHGAQHPQRLGPWSLNLLHTCLGTWEIEWNAFERIFSSLIVGRIIRGRRINAARYTLAGRCQYVLVATGKGKSMTWILMLLAAREA